MRRIGAVTCLALAMSISPTLSAQEEVNSLAFFALGAPVDVMVSTPRKSARMPWFEEYEFRTETRDFDLDQQEYTFRMAPSTGRKRRAQSALYQHQENRPDFDAQENACDALADRYADWVTLYYLDQEQAIINELSTVLDDRRTVLTKMAGRLDFDWAELIKLREAMTELELREMDRQTKVAYLKNSYGISTAALSFADLLNVRELPAKLASEMQPWLDPKLAYDMELANRELALEQAEQKQYVDFAQIRYQGPHTDLVRERLSIGVGLQLPNSGNQLLKLREIELEQAALQREAALEKTKQTLEYTNGREAWMLAYRRYEAMERTFIKERDELEEIANQLHRREGFDPLPLLLIQERTLRNQLKALSLAHDLHEDYLDVCEMGGRLCDAESGELLVR